MPARESDSGGNDVGVGISEYENILKNYTK